MGSFTPVELLCNFCSTIGRYHLSKILAEKAAWSFSTTPDLPADPLPPAGVLADGASVEWLGGECVREEGKSGGRVEMFRCCAGLCRLLCRAAFNR